MTGKSEPAIVVGTRLPDLLLPQVSRSTLAMYAGASGDHNPMHIDLDVARDAGMDDVFAHGMLSVAYLGRLLTGWVSQAQIRSLSVRFSAITPVLATPTCTGEVVSIDDVSGERRARVAVQVRLQDGTLTLTGEAVVAIK
jgi:acyl dehydratase